MPWPFLLLLLPLFVATATAQGPLPVDRELVVRLDADVGVVTDAANRVESWQNQTGAGADASQNTPFQRPQWVPNGAGELPIIRFDGLDDALLIGPTSSLDTDSLSWFVVVRVDQLPPGTQPGLNDVSTVLSTSYSSGAGSISDRTWGSFVNLDGSLGSFARTIDGAFVGSLTDATTGSFVVVSAVWDSNDQVNQYVDGVASPPGTGASAAPAGHVTTKIGAEVDALGALVRYLDGDVAEVLIYATDLTDGERQSVEAYLTEKWLVPAATPVPPPSGVVVTDPISDQLVSGLLTINADADGSDEVDFYVDNLLVGTATTPPFMTTFDSTLLPDGTAVVTAEARNAGGSTISAPVSIQIDNSGPVGEITMPADGDIVGGTVDFVATATDPSGIVDVNFLAGLSLDEIISAAPYATLYDSTLDSDGVVAMTILVEDEAGNVATDSISVTVDNTDPVATILTPSDDAIVSGTILIEADVTDANLDRVEFFAEGNSIGVDSDGSDGFSQAFDTTSTLDGGLGLEILALDLAGNSTRTSITVEVQNATPVNLIRRPGDGRRVRNNIHIRINATGINADIETVAVFADDQLLIETGSVCFDLPFDTRTVADGALDIVALAVDTAGQLYTDQITVTVKNLRKRFRPCRLKLSSDGNGVPVRLRLKGASVGLLSPVASHEFVLVIEGGGSITATGGYEQGCGYVLFVNFDRMELIELIEETFPEIPSRVKFQIFADGRQIGKVRLRVRP